MSEKSQEYIQRLATLERLKDMDVEPYPNDFVPTATTEECRKRFDSLTAEEFEGINEKVQIAGRMMSLRSFGRAAFTHIQDRKGRIQLYFKKDLLGEEGWKTVKLCDVGDIIGVEGRPFRTKTGELTIEVETLRLLAKGLHPLPEKWHGLKDVEIRYRQRYLDLMVNSTVRETFVKRTEIIRLIREFLVERDFLEVETPMMHAIPGGAAAKPFVTYHNALGMELYLRIAPELYLKRLLVGGFERVFEINRNFRNEGISSQHNPEFTMLEFYQAYATYEDLMELTERMLLFVLERLGVGHRVQYRGRTIDFSPPWERIPLVDAIVKYGGVEKTMLQDENRARELLKGLDPKARDDMPHGKVLAEIFEKTAEDKLVNPTFVTHYPVEVSPLARRNPQDTGVVDRFELIIDGKEIANAFSELNDPLDQKERFLRQTEERKRGDEEAHRYDEDFVRALEYGMPPAAGEGMGIDRLVMILTDSPSIRDVILFPLLKEKTER